MSFIRDTIRILPSSHSPALLERENSIDPVFPPSAYEPSQIRLELGHLLRCLVEIIILKNQSCLSSDYGCAQLGASGKCQIFQLAGQCGCAWWTWIPHCEHCSVCACHSQMPGFPLNWMLKSLKFLVMAVSVFLPSCVCSCAREDDVRILSFNLFSILLSLRQALSLACWPPFWLD